MMRSAGNGRNLEEKLRGGNGTEIFKSQGERRIARFLDQYGIRYVYEKPVAIVDENKTKLWHPDYFLPDLGVYIEFYGMAGQPDYDAGIARKTALYSANGIDVISLYPAHFRYDWQTHLRNELRNIQNYRRNALPRRDTSNVIRNRSQDYSKQTTTYRRGPAGYSRQRYR